MSWKSDENQIKMISIFKRNIDKIKHREKMTQRCWKKLMKWGETSRKPKKSLQWEIIRKAFKGNLIKHRTQLPINIECSAQIRLKPLLLYHHIASWKAKQKTNEMNNFTHYIRCENSTEKKDFWRFFWGKIGFDEALNELKSFEIYHN